MLADDPELFADLFRRIGDLMVEIWAVFLQRHSEHYAICRFGDDLGFRSSTLLAPTTIREHILPQYRRVIDQVHAAGKPFLLHSCGKIFRVMDDLIGLGIDAKHSNEDAIAPFDEWITRYGDRIGLLGGIDVDILCQQSPQDIVKDVVERGGRFRRQGQRLRPWLGQLDPRLRAGRRFPGDDRSCPRNPPQGATGNFTEQ